MSGGEGEEIGTLIVVVLKAQNLNDKHFFKQDVYAQVSFGGTTKKTKIDYKGGQHPVWDAELRFPVMKSTTNKFRELEVSCYAKEHRDDTLLGEAKVDMSTTLKSGEFDEWVPLHVNDVQRGDIYLEITYYRNGPAPPQSSLLAPPNPNSNLTSSNLNTNQNTNLLQRRPSKMSPADRLYRP
ncbi:C2 domain-containing protein, partial [Lentinula raphanica]